MIKRFIVIAITIASLLTSNCVLAAVGPGTITPNWIALRTVSCSLSISPSGLASCYAIASCNPDYSVGVVLRLYREIPNGGTLLYSWTSSILTPGTSTSGTYQINTTGNWYYAVATATTYFDGYIREVVEQRSTTVYY